MKRSLLARDDSPTEGRVVRAGCDGGLRRLDRGACVGSRCVISAGDRIGRGHQVAAGTRRGVWGNRAGWARVWGVFGEGAAILHVSVVMTAVSCILVR